jgi:NAD(P)H-flavin reductase
MTSTERETPRSPLVPAPFRVQATTRETLDVVTVKLEPADGDGNDPGVFEPGQFNMLTVFGVGVAAVSLSGDPRRSLPLEHTVRAVGPVTRAVCAAHRGSIVGINGPYGRGWPVHEAQSRDVVVMGGGIGLAPLRPAIHRVLAERERYGRFILLYGARSPDDLLFRRELEAWRGRFDAVVEVTVDHASSGWRGNVGVVTRLLERVYFDPDHTLAMVCGPEVMMRFSAQGLQARGVPASRIHLSLERHMKCGVGMCGRCQHGPSFVCRDGPVFSYDRLRPLLRIQEL